jgi:tetratricopeptide (TPR) repeat protein
MAAKLLVATFLGLLALIACAAGVARAELKITDLTDSAVPGVGPHYQDVADAIATFAKGDYRTTFARLQNAKKVTPALPPAEVMMAQLYFDATQGLPGIAMLEQAIQTSPQDPEAYVALMERAVAEGRVTEAAYMFPATEKLAQAFNQNPRRKQNLLARLYTAGAAADEAQQRLGAARTKLEALVKLDQRDASAHEKLGRVLFAQNEQKAAYAEFQLAAKANKDGPPAELMMASLFPDKINAERWLNFAISKNPDDLKTHLGAASYYLKINQPSQARQHAIAALKLDPDNFDGQLVSGLIARMEGDFPTAEKHLSQAHLLQPGNFDVVNHLALVLVELPDEASRLRALQFAELSARENPRNPNYLSALGWINYRLDRKPEAERAFRAVLEPARDGGAGVTSEMGYFMANLAKDSGNTAEAIQMLRSALDNAQPFAYRKMAEQLLAQLTQSSEGASKSTQTGQQAPKADPNSPRAK